MCKTPPIRLYHGCLRKGLPLFMAVILETQAVEVDLGFQVPLLSFHFMWMFRTIGPTPPAYMHLPRFLHLCLHVLHLLAWSTMTAC